MRRSGADDHPKSAIDRRLAPGGIPFPMRPERSSSAYELGRDEEVAAGMARIATARAEKALERLRGIQSGQLEAAEAVHGARKDLKKVRAVLRIVRPRLSERAYRGANRHFRDAGRALSASRDAEVKLETLAALGEHVELPAAEVESWRAILERDRAAASDTNAERRALEEATGSIEAGQEEIERWELTGNSWKLVGAGLGHTYKRGRRAMREAEARPSDESFHEWRKRAKDHWYELRLLREAWPAPMDALAEEAHALSELLGDHHDLALLRADLELRNLDAGATDALRQAIAARQGELAGAAFPLGARLYAERPRDFRHRLHAYWHAWRG